jgi:SNF2 family DNA or RNA helicase
MKKLVGVQDKAGPPAPFPHQVTAFMISRDREAFALLMEQGTGKSRVIIDTSHYLWTNGKIDSVMIIAPKGVYQNWVVEGGEFDTHYPLSDRIRIDEVVWKSDAKVAESELLKRSLGLVPSGTLRVLVMNVEAFSASDRAARYAQAYLKTHKVLMVIDESNCVANPKSKCTKVLVQLGGMARYRRILTGTPIGNSPLDLYAQFRFLDPSILGHNSFFSFRNAFAIVRKVTIGSNRFDQVVGYQNLGQLQQLIKDSSFRILKKECLDLPPKIYQKVWFPMAPAQRAIYDDLRLKSVAEIAESNQQITTELVITKMMRLQQIAAGFATFDFTDKPESIHKDPDSDPRMKLFEDTLSRIMRDDPTRRVLVWSHYRWCLARLEASVRKSLGPGSVAIFHGGIKQEDRLKGVRDFQDLKSKVRVLVANPQAAGRGLTLTAASHVIYFTCDYSLLDRSQSEDRTHRIGQDKSVVYTDILAEDSIDKKVLAMLMKKVQLAQLVTGDRWKSLFE